MYDALACVCLYCINSSGFLELCLIYVRVYIYTDMDIDIDRFMFIFFYFIQQESQGVLV